MPPQKKPKRVASKLLYGSQWF